MGVVSQKLVHRFIWEYFHGEIPHKYVLDHINSIKSDNRKSNLRVVTNRQNVMFGRSGKLTEEQVTNIKGRIHTERGRDLAREFNISEQLICDIKYSRKHNK